METLPPDDLLFASGGGGPRCLPTFDEIGESGSRRKSSSQRTTTTVASDEDEPHRSASSTQPLLPSMPSIEEDLDQNKSGQQVRVSPSPTAAPSLEEIKRLIEAKREKQRREARVQEMLVNARKFFSSDSQYVCGCDAETTSTATTSSSGRGGGGGRPEELVRKLKQLYDQ